MNKVKENNFEVIGMIAYYLINHSDFIKKEMIDNICNEYINEEEAFFLLFISALGLDFEIEDDKYLIDNYLRKSVKRLNKEDYINNEYYKNIKVDNIKYHNFEFRKEKYKPYEAFIYNDLIVEEDYKEIPRVGYFNEEFEYLALLENDNEWMMITPNEINTMQKVIDEVYGNVITFGLGLGYFAYMASLKNNVKSVTIIEKDKSVIDLFEKYILPQFREKDKIKIICCDAFEYARTMEGYDCAFVDLWHDVSDGVPMYLKMKELEKENIKYYYWIIDSILSNLRWK